MGCCCSIKSPSQTTLGREVECPKCQQLFPSHTTNHAFNDHLDNCLMSSQQNINKIEDYRGIKYWEKVQNEQGFQWVLHQINNFLLQFNLFQESKTILIQHKISNLYEYVYNINKQLYQKTGLNQKIKNLWQIIKVTERS